MSAATSPWQVIPSPTDPEMFAVQGVYLVADNLPIEDARLIAAAPALLEALGWLESYLRDTPHHNAPAAANARAAIALAKGEAK